MKFLPILVLLLVIGCKKEARVPERPLTAELTLSRTWFTQYTGGTRVEKKYEYARAMFVKNNQYTTPAGTVTYGDSTLHKQSFSNIYFSYNPDEEKLNFNPAWNGNKLWAVSGSIADTVPPVSVMAAPFPSFFFKESDTMQVIHKSMYYTINWDNSIPSDSISIGIYQGNTHFETGNLPGHLTTLTLWTGQLSEFENFTPAYLIMEGRSYRNTKSGNMNVKVETVATRNFMVKIID